MHQNVDREISNIHQHLAGWGGSPRKSQGRNSIFGAISMWSWQSPPRIPTDLVLISRASSGRDNVWICGIAKPIFWTGFNMVHPIRSVGKGLFNFWQRSRSPWCESLRAWCRHCRNVLRWEVEKGRTRRCISMNPWQSLNSTTEWDVHFFYCGCWAYMCNCISLMSVREVPFFVCWCRFASGRFSARQIWENNPVKLPWYSLNSLTGSRGRRCSFYIQGDFFLVPQGLWIALAMLRAMMEQDDGARMVDNVGLEQLARERPMSMGISDIAVEYLLDRLWDYTMGI